MLAYSYSVTQLFSYSSAVGRRLHGGGTEAVVRSSPRGLGWLVLVHYAQPANQDLSPTPHPLPRLRTR
jgi:hypothetical protein